MTSKPLPEAQQKTLVQSCMDEVQAPGTYSISPGRPSANPESALPRASAVVRLGATQSGAEAINACIQRRGISAVTSAG